MFNVENYLGKCLESCLCQKNFPDNQYEIIVVNDGSSDGSLSIAEDFKQHYPNIITIFSQKNAGLSAARNKGLELSKGDYVWFIDSDDWIASNSLMVLFPYLDGKNDMIIIGSMRVYEKGISVGRRYFKDIRIMTGKEAFLQHVEQTQTAPFSVMRRAFLNNNKLQFAVGLLHEDNEFCPRATYLAKQITFTPLEIYFNLLTQRNSITSVVNPKRAYDLLTVALLLDKFRIESVKEIDINKRFYLQEAFSINQGLNVIIQCDKTEQRKFNIAYYQNRKVFNRSLAHALPKNKIEYILFILFPHFIVELFLFLRFFKKNRN